MSTMNERYLPTAARVTLGGIFLVFGLNGLLHFMPMPEPPPRGADFLGALAVSGYMFPLIKLVEIAAGAMLLTNRYVPLALALLAPGVVNILLFHAYLAPGGIWLALLLLVLLLYLAWSYRDLYRPMLSARTIPTARKRPDQQFHRDMAATRAG